MAAVISTLPLPSAVPRDALWKGKRKSFKGKLLQLRAKSFRSRSRRMPVVRVYARTRSTARPGSRVKVGARSSGNSLYDLLGISDQVSSKEIKKAYREKARKYHPDSNPPAKKDECTQKFLQVQEAYRVLGDADLKEDYDYTLRNPQESLKSAISFRRGKSRARGAAAGCVADEDLENKHAWRSKWRSQLFGLQSAPSRSGRKPGSWAATVFHKRHETPDHGL